MLNNKKIFIAILSIFALSGCKGPTPTPTPERDPDWINKSNWFNLTSNAISSDIGKTATIKVNNQNHLVRLIDIDHDVDEQGNKLHTTWEFANLISDTEGYSLAYQWKDVQDDNVANQDYINSSIRKILCGNGNFATDIYCATRSSSHDSDATKNNWDFNYTNKTILSMLPSDFQKSLKTTKKKVRSGTTYEDVQEYSDKLFLLTSNEIGTFLEKDEGTTYSYYKDTEEFSNKRKKHQVKENAEVLKNTTINPSEKVTACKQTIWCYAGFKSDATGVEGCYWLSSPDSNNSKNDKSYSCNGSGKINSNCSNCYALGIAPAFCI